jgi:dimethylamine corrinoid protein
MSDELRDSLVELEEQEVLSGVEQALASGTDPITLVEQLREGMSIIGQKFEAREYYLSELIMSAEIFKESIALIEPHLEGSAGQGNKGTIVIGTVKGDIHDIGKNIVATLLRCEGYEVIDLGVDVPAGDFVDRTRESGAKLVALSGLLTPAFDEMKQTIEALDAAGLRAQASVVIGGGPVNQTVVDYTGADAWGRDAAHAVRLAEGYLAS